MGQLCFILVYQQFPIYWITSGIARIISGLAKGANASANEEAAKDPN